MKKLFSILFGLLLAAIFVKPAFALEPEDLVGWWNFREESDVTAVDDSLYNNDGSYTSVTLDGEHGTFNGSSSNVVVSDDDSSLDITNAVTIEAWIDPAAITDYRTIVSKRLNSESNYSFRISDGKLEFYYKSGADSNWSEWTTDNPVVFSESGYDYVAVVYTWGDDVQMYFNGAGPLVGHWVYASSASMVAPNDYALHIGYNYSGYPQAFNGGIDEVRIWNKALERDDLGISNEDVALLIDPDDDDDGVLDDVDLCEDTSSDDPENWGTNRWMWDEERGWIVNSPPTKKGQGNGANPGFTIEETQGCSCTQILDKMREIVGDDFEGHDKNMCSKSIVEDWISGEYYLETVYVPSDETAVYATSYIMDDETYRLYAKGTYTYATWAGEPLADAKCSYGGPNDPLQRLDWTNGNDLHYPYTNYLEIRVNDSVVDWGIGASECSLTHEYNMDITGVDGFSFNIFDGGAISDNDGGIPVDIFVKLY